VPEPSYSFLFFHNLRLKVGHSESLVIILRYYGSALIQVPAIDAACACTVFKSGKISASKRFDSQPRFLSIPSKIHDSLLLEPFLTCFWKDSGARGVQKKKVCLISLFSKASLRMQRIRPATLSFRVRESLRHAHKCTRPYISTPEWLWGAVEREVPAGTELW
jgi:hypothetical protein